MNYRESKGQALQHHDVVEPGFQLSPLNAPDNEWFLGLQMTSFGTDPWIPVVCIDRPSADWHRHEEGISHHPKCSHV